MDTSLEWRRDFFSGTLYKPEMGIGIIMAIENAKIADNGHLILVLEDGSTVDAGNVRGIPGPQGERGIGVKGDPGEPGPAGAGISNTVVQNTITLSSTGTQPATGTRTIQRIESQTLGDKVSLTYKLGFAGGTAGSGEYLLSLPTGMTFNTTYNPVMTSALWTGDVQGMAPYSIPAYGGIVIQSWWSNQIFVVPYDSTRFRVAVTGNGDQTAFRYWGYGFYHVASNTMLNLKFEIWK
jgi:hypothetical protein